MCFACTTDDNDSSETSHLKWVNTYGGSKNDALNSIVNTQDGGYAVLGYTQSTDGDVSNNPTENYDYWLLKYNSQDVLQWNKTYGGSHDDRGTDMVQTQDGGYVVVGYSKSADEDVTTNAGLNDLWIVKLDGFGQITWEKSLGYSGTDKAQTVIQTSDGGYFIVGLLDVTASGGEGNSRVMHAGGDYWAVRLDATGNTLWTKYFGGNNSETPYDTIQTEDGGFIIVGTSDSSDVDITNNIGQYDYWIVKIDAVGSLVWEKTFGGTGIDEAHSIAKTEANNFLIFGKTFSEDVDVSNNNGQADAWLIKIDSVGNLLWEKTFGGSGFDSGDAICQLQDGNYALTGSTRSQDGDLELNNGQNDVFVFKISANGNLLWNYTLGGTEADFAYDIIEQPNRELILVGNTASSDVDIIENKGFTDGLIAKLK